MVGFPNLRCYQIAYAGVLKELFEGDSGNG